MGLFDRLFGHGNQNDDEHPPAMPWDQNPSILEFITSHLDDNKILTPEGADLPDKARINDGSKISWAAGAMDGVMTHHMGGGNQDEIIQQLVRLVINFSEQPTATNKAVIYRFVMDENTISMIDPVLEALTSENEINHQRLYEIAYSFATEAPDREPVKFGVAILGLYETDNESIFQRLGRHDEFTLFCAVALANQKNNAEQSLWELARSVDGWGRIHVVERLRDPADPAVRDWLLREGYKNSIMYEYLAYTAACAGRLLEALSVDSIDRELLTSAGEILHALSSGGPAESMDDYEDASKVLPAFLRHVENAEETLADFVHVRSVQYFLEDNDADWDQLECQGWTLPARTQLEESCQKYLGRPIWHQMVTHSLQSHDDNEFHLANQVAKTLGIDTWEFHLQRLKQSPTDSGRWYQAVSIANEAQLPELFSLAESTFDFAKLTIGPADELGLGKDWELDSCLGYLVQELRRFPHQGILFIHTALQNPVVRNRNMGLNALNTWARDQWDESTASILERAISKEPCEDVRERMEKTLRGEPED